MPCPAQNGRRAPSPLPDASWLHALQQVRSELANIDNAESVGAVAGHEQLRSVVANETTSRPSASSRPVQLVLDRRLLELIPIDSVTLSNEHGHGERAHCRRYGADLLSPGPVIAARRHGCSAL
jgi:hypothetical protein